MMQSRNAESVSFTSREGTKAICIFGATGSIGTSTLFAMDYLGLPLAGFSFHRNLTRAIEIIEKYRPLFVFCLDAENRNKLKQHYPHLSIYSSWEEVELCVNKYPHIQYIQAIDGWEGIFLTWQLVRWISHVSYPLLIANKESFILGDIFLASAIREKKILPIDSEHWSLFELLEHEQKEHIQKYIITASGGMIWKARPEEIQTWTKHHFLQHPNWSMGQLITLYSQTLMNKCLELLEMKTLFFLEGSQVEAYIHPQSTIHAILQKVDGSYVFHAYPPHMVIPIQGALLYPEKREIYQPQPFSLPQHWDIEEIPEEKYPLYFWFRHRILDAPLSERVLFVLWGQWAHQQFLNDKISFFDIPAAIQTQLDRMPKAPPIHSAEDLLAWIHTCVLEMENLEHRKKY